MTCVGLVAVVFVFMMTFLYYVESKPERRQGRRLVLLACFLAFHLVIS